MKETTLGNLEGYTHREIKMSNHHGVSGLAELSTKFYKEVIDATEGKEVIWRVSPKIVSDDGNEFRCYARLHIKD